MSRLHPRLATFGPLALRRVLLVSRPALWVNTLGVAVTGLWLSGHLWNAGAAWLSLLAYLTLPFNLLIYGLNDLSDLAEDARSERKGGWQGARLRGGEAAPLLVWIAALNLPFLGLLAALLPPAAFGVLLLSAGLFAGYSLRPLRFKGRPFIDGLSNVAYALPLLIPALLLGAAPPLLACAALCAYAVGKHAFDAAQIFRPTRGRSTHTVATRLGRWAPPAYALALVRVSGALLWPLSPRAARRCGWCCGGHGPRAVQCAPPLSTPPGCIR